MFGFMRKNSTEKKAERQEAPRVEDDNNSPHNDHNTQDVHGDSPDGSTAVDASEQEPTTLDIPEEDEGFDVNILDEDHGQYLEIPDETPEPHSAYDETLQHDHHDEAPQDADDDIDGAPSDDALLSVSEDDPDAQANHDSEQENAEGDQDTHNVKPQSFSWFPSVGELSPEQTEEIARHHEENSPVEDHDDHENDDHDDQQNDLLDEEPVDEHDDEDTPEEPVDVVDLSDEEDDLIDGLLGDDEGEFSIDALAESIDSEMDGEQLEGEDAHTENDIVEANHDEVDIQGNPLEETAEESHDHDIQEEAEEATPENDPLSVGGSTVSRDLINEISNEDGEVDTQEEQGQYPDHESQEHEPASDTTTPQELLVAVYDDGNDCKNALGEYVNGRRVYVVDLTNENNGFHRYIPQGAIPSFIDLPEGVEVNYVDAKSIITHAAENGGDSPYLVIVGADDILEKLSSAFPAGSVGEKIIIEYCENILRQARDNGVGVIIAATELTDNLEGFLDAIDYPKDSI